MLSGVLRSLSPAWREHVVALDAGGRLHATTPGLASAFTVMPAEGDSLLGGLLHHLLPGANGGVQVECRGEKSGPYRRVYSRPGFAYQSATVTLPSDLPGDLFENKPAGHGDTVFVYAGGWGGRGGAVDAGFQHGRYANGSQDDWAPFFLVQQPRGKSAIVLAPDKQADGGPWRLLAGQDVFLAFFVTRVGGETRLNLSVRGELSRERVPAALTLSAPVDGSFGWDPRGGGNVLKRMTTIGQTYGRENLASGSFVRGVRWRDARIGTTEADAAPWRAEHTGGYCSYPDPKTPEGRRADRPDAPRWEVAFVSPAEETDAVTLK